MTQLSYPHTFYPHTVISALLDYAFLFFQSDALSIRSVVDRGIALGRRQLDAGSWTPAVGRTPLPAATDLQVLHRIEML